MNHRPLSPHLSIYRLAYTMVLSILHRITGVALAIGLVVLALWLMSTANGPDSYERFLSWAASPLFRILIAGWLVAFLYHFTNGIRHLFWDAGVGLERAQARSSARHVITIVAVASVVLIYVFFFRSSAT
jgi:succinate dehydrogenase / fumarate reductase, cytochrome b subunit